MTDDILVGIDTGGTFTDFVVHDARGLRVHKVLSTPDAPERAILAGIADLGLNQAVLRVTHGSTVATNAVLEGKGVRTAFVTNRGFRDLLSIGRQARRALYDLQPAAIAPPVPPELCLETGGRIGADGQVIDALTAQDIAELCARLRALAPRAVAIDLLFSYLDDRWERAIADALPPDLFVARSSQVLPEYREYERGIATWLNAYVGPLMDDYLNRLTRALPSARVAVMQSSGGTIASEQAGRRAVHLLLSGPAGGLMGARSVGQAAGRTRLLSFDMGGTSTDVALIDGEPRLTSEGAIGPYPVAVPMVDMHTIGAGGGSIARVDVGGLLQVGPESAGADPGPACYGHGGREPTVTDANVVLGRLRPEAFLGGAMELDAAAARAAVAVLAAHLGLSIEAAAAGIVELANEHMARALRVISVQRGIDPRGFTLLSFGGAGGLHVCALARALGMRQAMVPVHAGVLSALGMLSAPRARQLSRTVGGLLGARKDAELDAQYRQLIDQGQAELAAEGVPAAAVRADRSLDLRYAGQSYTLNLRWEGVGASVRAFHDAHAERYGHRLDLPVEVVNVRVGLAGPPPAPVLAPIDEGADAAPIPLRQVDLHGVEGAVPVYERAPLPAGAHIEGPAVITETVATTYLEPSWRAEVDCYGNLLLERT